ncbi:MAG: DUF72 domain-containing protein [Actinomycetota bacterium]|nr:DUF72 domain-containing protein [Actinomycetota bacterium]
MTLFVGTSGWAYKEWKPDFYPADLPQTRFLEHYGRELSACEINATFYRLQSEDTFTKWAAGTPKDFRFAIKAHRGLTHSKKLAPSDDNAGLMTRFLESIRTLGERLGVILFQLPPYRKRDDDALQRLLDALPEGPGYAFEFRNDTWDNPDVRALLATRGAALCISETKGEVPQSLPDGRVAYIRLRAERYTAEGRAGWLDLLTRESASRDVYAFAKHEGIPAGDPFGGIGLAQWLRAKTMGEEGEPATEAVTLQTDA